MTAEKHHHQRHERPDPGVGGELDVGKKQQCRGHLDHLAEQQQAARMMAAQQTNVEFVESQNGDHIGAECQRIEGLRQLEISHVDRGGTGDEGEQAAVAETGGNR